MQGENAENPVKPNRRLASTKKYVSPNQLTLGGFETPFEQKLTKSNRWVKLSCLIPWDRIVNLYNNQFSSKEGRPPINGRIVIGAVIIKHMLDLSDRETILQIQENMFMQHFLGYSSFTNEPPFDASLFVDIRERLSLSVLSEIDLLIVAHQSNLDFKINCSSDTSESDQSTLDTDNTPGESPTENKTTVSEPKTTHKGTLLMDATVAPQNVTFPTDLKLLNAAREKSEEIIDKLYNKEVTGSVKPRTYRQNARKDFLNTNKKKRKTYNEIKLANSKQINYLSRNIKHIENLLADYEEENRKAPMTEKLSNYFETIKNVRDQQVYMLKNGVNSIENRIVNIHQPHVRPIVRGKEGKKVEFGSKIQLALIDGFSFVDKLSWDAFNEGTCLIDSVENYRKRFGVYPEKVLADQIYCTRSNRSYLKEKGIKLHAKALGRPSKEAMSNHVSPGERNPVEGKFGQAKRAYGMDNIMAKLKTTSESWIGSIVLVLNLVKLAGMTPLWIKLFIMRIKMMLKINFLKTESLF